MFLATHAAPRRHRRFFRTGGAPPPPPEIDRRTAADTMTSAHSSTCRTDSHTIPGFFHQTLLHMVVLLVMLPLACSGPSLLIQTTFSDITLMKRNLHRL